MPSFTTSSRKAPLSIAILLGLGVFLVNACSSVPTVAKAAPKTFSIAPALIDAAVAEPLVAYEDNLQNRPMDQAKAVYFMALLVHLAPEITTTNGIFVRDRLLEQIRSLTTSGQEPNANGALSGWTHNNIAHAFLLARRTPQLWDSLKADEQTRMDWLMRAMAIAGHFDFDDDNDFKTDLRNQGNFRKTWNPNFREGYVGVVIAASLYFGPSELNRIFTSFNYDEYIARFKAFGFSNLLAAWTSYDWKPILEKGGEDRYGGSGKGVKNIFTYGGVGLDNPFGIFKKLADYMYAFEVFDGLTIDGKRYSWTLGDQSSPVLGQLGMCREFKSADASGPRSSLAYANEGWINSLTTRATLEVLGAWKGPKSDVAAVEAKMQVGSDDLIFKATQGFSGYSHGGHMAIRNQEKLARNGYLYDKAIWQQLVKPGVLHQ